MEKRRKKGRKGDASSKSEQKSSSEVTLDQFLERAVHQGKIRPWQRKEIAVFFRDKKLKDKEDSKIYEETLKKY